MSHRNSGKQKLKQNHTTCKNNDSQSKVKQNDDRKKKWQKKKGLDIASDVPKMETGETRGHEQTRKLTSPKESSRAVEQKVANSHPSSAVGSRKRQSERDWDSGRKFQSKINLESFKNSPEYVFNSRQNGNKRGTGTSFKQFESDRNLGSGYKSSRGKTRRNRNKHRAEDTQSSSLKNDTEDDSLEIPGFYYDREKKKYFRIQSSQFSKINHTLTKETIERKEKEVKRLKDLSSPGKCAKKLFQCSLPSWLKNQNTGEVTSRQVCNFVRYSRLQSIDLLPAKSFKVINDRLEHCLSMQMNPDHKQILGLWSLKNSMIYKIESLTVSEKSKHTENDKLNINVTSPTETGTSPLPPVFNKVTCLSWVNIPGETSYDGILHTIISCTGDSDSLAVIRSIDQASNRQTPFYQNFNLGRKTAWCCAWNKYSNQFSVGSEKCGLLIDTETRRMWELYTNKSDVLSQVFTSQSGNCLYGGTRSGHIVIHDLRSKSLSRFSGYLQMSSSVCGLNLLTDDINLVASDVKGKVALWDLRMRKILLEYYGNKNSYSCIPIGVDEDASVVYGADQEGYTRLWCLQTGHILKTIPPPVATSIETIPSVLYSSQWSGRPGNSAVVIGIEDKFYLYPS